MRVSNSLSQDIAMYIYIVILGLHNWISGRKIVLHSTLTKTWSERWCVYLLIMGFLCSGTNTRTTCTGIHLKSVPSFRRIARQHCTQSRHDAWNSVGCHHVSCGGAISCCCGGDYFAPFYKGGLQGCCPSQITAWLGYWCPCDWHGNHSCSKLLFYIVNYYFYTDPV